jgi:hypothetical protein
VCRQSGEKDFKKKLKDLERRTNEKDKEFVKGLMNEKEKWALSYDKGGKHCGYMTSNMTEIFSSILRGVLSHPVLRPNRILIVCVSMNQIYTHTV